MVEVLRIDYSTVHTKETVNYAAFKTVNYPYSTVNDSRTLTHTHTV